MTRSTRKSFMSKIAAAAKARPVTEPNPPAIEEEIVRLARHGQKLVTLFVEQVALSGAVPHVANTSEELAAVMRSIVSEAKVKTAIADADESIAPLVQAAQAAGAAVEKWGPQSDLSGSFEVDAGLTGAKFGVAETGSLVMASSPLTARLTSLAPRVHVAMIRQGQILPDLVDLLSSGEIADGSGMPSALTLITGPSKTADIELKLVTGVHGPGIVHVIVVP